MRIIKILVVLTLTFSISKRTNSQGFTYNANIGYDSGFTTTLGGGLVAGDGSFFISYLGLKYLNVDSRNYFGPNLNIFVSPGFFGDSTFGIGLGLDIAFLNGENNLGNNDWQLNTRPELGITIAGILVLKYGYNLSNTDDFYTDRYNRNSLSLSINIFGVYNRS